MNMDKKNLKMISLSAVIGCFGNISVAGAVEYGKDIVCLPINDKTECKKKILVEDCDWISDVEDLKRLTSTGEHCFKRPFLFKASCTYQESANACNKLTGCFWDGECKVGTSPSVCSPRETPAKCADRSQEGKCFWKGNFFGKGGKCLPVGSTVKK